MSTYSLNRILELCNSLEISPDILDEKKKKKKKHKSGRRIIGFPLIGYWGHSGNNDDDDSDGGDGGDGGGE